MSDRDELMWRALGDASRAAAARGQRRPGTGPVARSVSTSDPQGVGGSSPYSVSQALSCAFQYLIKALQADGAISLQPPASSLR